ncbi:MAG: YciI family protein, partial [Alphaproteobacteria bacterium]
MHWLIKCRSKPGTDALREATIDAHRDFLDGYPEVTWYSGPIFSDDNKNALGSLRLIEFPDRDTALAYINADPYTKAGIFQSITVER